MSFGLFLAGVTLFRALSWHVVLCLLFGWPVLRSPVVFGACLTWCALSMLFPLSVSPPRGDSRD